MKRLLCTVLLLAAACDLTGEQPLPPADWELGHTSEEIRNGTAVFPFSAQAVRVGGCSGTLVSPRWVLTAAHCYKDKNPATKAVRFLSQTRQVTHIKYHYNSAKYHGSSDKDVDVVMLRLSAPFTNIKAKTVPIFSGDTKHLIGDEVHCFGYGAQDYYGSCDKSSDCKSGDFCKWGVCMVPSDVLRTGNFKVKEDHKNKDVYFQLTVPNDMDQNPLPGDSGGACWSYPYGAVLGTTKAGNVNSYSRYISGESFGTWASSNRSCPVYDSRSPNPGQCSLSCKCDVGEGDCDSDAQCRSGLVCAKNVGKKYGLPADYDMCEAPKSCPTFNAAKPEPGFCKDKDGCPCTYGQGDCDSDFECGGSLICRDNIGKAANMPKDYDLCVYPRDPGCSAFKLSSPSKSFCSPGCPCDLGEGHCDSSNECRDGLVCAKNRGADVGLPSDYSVCVKPKFIIGPTTPGPFTPIKP